MLDSVLGWGLGRGTRGCEIEGFQSATWKARLKVPRGRANGPTCHVEPRVATSFVSFYGIGPIASMVGRPILNALNRFAATQRIHLYGDTSSL